MISQKTTQILLILMALTVVVAACNQAIATPPPTPTPTPTRLPPAPRNDNVEALTSAQAAVEDFEFGLAPLLLENDTVIEINSGPEGQLARMVYPPQPAAITGWPSVDSFVLSYGVRQLLLDDSQVVRVVLGKVGVSASVENSAEDVEHTAVWVTFVDGSRAVVDLSPLSTNFAPRHIPSEMMTDENEIEEEFAQRRNGVDLGMLQPMLVVEQGGELLLVVARVVVTYERYEFWLQVHPVRKADPMRVMELSPGAAAGVEINRAEFAKLQQLLEDAGLSAFDEQPDLLIRRGRQDETLAGVMDENLYLLWHLLTKFKHELPDPNVPTPTPIPTATPTPTPPPTPTATPRKAPLLTS